MKLFRHGARAERAGAVDARASSATCRCSSPTSRRIGSRRRSWRRSRRSTWRKCRSCPRARASARRSAGRASSSPSASTTASTPPRPARSRPRSRSSSIRRSPRMQGPDDDVALPEGSEQMDWEVELGVIIGNDGAARARRTGAVLCRRLLPRQRRVRAALADPSRRAMGEGQELRHIRAARPLSGDGRRNPDPQNAAGFAEGQRRAAAEQQHQRHDLLSGRDRRHI